jgi:hypothetical protein
MTNKILKPEDYKVLYKADLVSDGAVAQLLNHNGACNWTVCPECKIDDFVHSAGCNLRKEAVKAMARGK